MEIYYIWKDLTKRQIQANFMKTNKLSDLTLEELNKQKNSLKGVLIGLGIVTLIAYSILLYLAIKNRNFVLIAIIPCGAITLLPGLIRWSQLNTEIKSRQTK